MRYDLKCSQQALQRPPGVTLLLIESLSRYFCRWFLKQTHFFKEAIFACFCLSLNISKVNQIKPLLQHLLYYLTSVKRKAKYCHIRLVWLNKCVGFGSLVRGYILNCGLSKRVKTGLQLKKLSYPNRSSNYLKKTHKTIYNKSFKFKIIEKSTKRCIHETQKKTK